MEEGTKPGIDDSTGAGRHVEARDQGFNWSIGSEIRSWIDVH